MSKGFVRIGDKVISIGKINELVKDILDLRSKGYSQQETAVMLKVDRTLISRLEKIGEVRKGADIAVIGFPILNKDEIYEALEEAGVDYTLLMNEEERNDFVNKQSGTELFNSIMSIASKVREYHNVITIGSDYRNKVTRALLDNHVYAINIGRSPIKEDIYVDPKEIIEVINIIKSV